MLLRRIITNFAIIACACAHTHNNKVRGMKQQNHIIGFDAKIANSTPEGRGFYGRFIIDAVATACPKRGYFRMYVPKRMPNSAYDKLELKHNVESMEPDGRLWRTLSNLWRYAWVSRDAKVGRVELFHGLANKLPFGLARRDIRSIVTIHDLTFMRNVEDKSPIMTFINRYRYRDTCKRADRVVTVSEFMKGKIVEHLNIDPDKIDVIHMGCDKMYCNKATPEQCENVRKKYNLPANYVLSVGTITENANIELCIKALAKSNIPISLVIAGRASTHIDRLRLEIEHFGMKERVHILCGVAAEDMPAIYSNAIAYLATERYASFNYHIVEALNIGTAVVAVRGTSHEEAAGPDSAYVSPDDSEELRQAIEGIAINMALREDMVAKGKAYAQRFRPEVIAYNILKCYSRVGIDIRE